MESENKNQLRADDPKNFFIRQDITVLPSDNPKDSIGWTFKEVIGVGVINTYVFLPWYKKIFTKTFWNRHLFYKFKKSKEVQYQDKEMIG